MRRTTVKLALYRPSDGVLARHHCAAGDFPCPKRRGSKRVLDKSGFVTMFVTEHTLRRRYRVEVILYSLGLWALAIVVGCGALLLLEHGTVGKLLSSPHLLTILFRLSVVPTLAVTLWMWLPIISALLFKAAYRLDIGFQWYTYHVDVKHKPILAIGPAAGFVLAMVYGLGRLLVR